MTVAPLSRDNRGREQLVGPLWLRSPEGLAEMASVAWSKRIECKDQKVSKVKCRLCLEKLRSLHLDPLQTGEV